MINNRRNRRRLPELVIDVIRYPADGSPPQLIKLPNTEKGVRSSMFNYLYHSPDFEPYWGENMTSIFRDAQQVEVINQEPPTLDGLYYFFYVHARPGETLNRSKPRILNSLDITGDIFLARTTFGHVRPDGFADFMSMSEQVLNLTGFKPEDVSVNRTDINSTRPTSYMTLLRDLNQMRPPRT